MKTDYEKHRHLYSIEFLSLLFKFRGANINDEIDVIFIEIINFIKTNYDENTL